MQSKYINFGEASVDLQNRDQIIEKYSEGYIFIRTEKGKMERIRSLRVNLKEYTASSENRRILRKFEHEARLHSLPLKNYTWQIHKMGKDFYEERFGKDIFSANKIKELFTAETNFNSVLLYNPISESNQSTNLADGYVVLHTSSNSTTTIVHYCYPFHRTDFIGGSFGIYMMTKAIEYFKYKGFDYIYLGSVHEERAIYKLQFPGVEWRDEKKGEWNKDIKLLKDILRKK